MKPEPFADAGADLGPMEKASEIEIASGVASQPEAASLVHDCKDQEFPSSGGESRQQRLRRIVAMLRAGTYFIPAEKLASALLKAFFSRKERPPRSN